MTIRPIDIQTSVMANNEASRLREAHQHDEKGASQLLTQNQDRDQQKTDTIQAPKEAEHKSIKKEDEDAEREKGSNQGKKGRKDKPEEERNEPVPAVDGVRGLKIDLKA